MRQVVPLGPYDLADPRMKPTLGSLSGLYPFAGQIKFRLKPPAGRRVTWPVLTLHHLSTDKEGPLITTHSQALLGGLCTRSKTVSPGVTRVV